MSRSLASLVILAFALAACAAPASAPPPVAATAAPTAGAPAAAQGAPTPYAPPAGTQLRTVRLAQSVPALSFAPLIVARAMGFFEKQGVKLDFIQLQSGTTAQQALIGGSIDVVDSASTEVAGAVARGLPLIAIQNTINQTLELCARSDYLAKSSVTPASPIKDRVAALKGATIGITGPGAASDKTMRWLLIKFAGLDPNKDTNITQVGGAEAMSGALEQNRIQAFLLSPPNCEIAKGGIVLLKPSEVSEFKNYVHEVLYTTKDWASKNKDLATRTATAISMGNNFMLKYPEQSIEILKKQFSNVDPRIVEATTREIILPQVIKDGKMTEAQWKDTNTVLLESGLIDKALDIKEGVVWTNEYIGDASIP